jgi:tetratricopeptide (TPR) repeat protein
LERQSLHTQYVQTLAQLVTAQWQAGDWPQAVIYAQQALAEDGFNEAVLRHYLALRHAQGDRTTAVSRYQEFAQQLKEELDVEPLPETTAVCAAIQNNQTAEQIFALAELKAAPEEAPTTRPLRQTPGTVPAPLRPLVGRTAEQAALIKLLTAQPPVRLLTLTGIGGIGKTQLAIAVATHLQTHCAAQFADGCYFVPLASLTTPAQVWTAVADRLGIKTNNKNSPFAQLQEQLRYKNVCWRWIILNICWRPRRS